jgi:hypothetical protein
MKYILSVLLLLPLIGFSQTYYLKVDSVNIIKIKIGKTYTYQMGVDVKTEEFKGFNGDSMIFESGSYHFKSIDGLKNPKRKAGLDALAFPLSIGSCVAVSTIPISYVKGYFLADTDRMFNTLGLFIGETIIFAASRSYLSKNKKWIKIKDLETLDYGEKA